ncbi:MAG: hypothetical protein KF764_24385 [Labilithrix sp.]|nr:hypothetical protein [Labilithrix sp.]
MLMTRACVVTLLLGLACSAFATACSAPEPTRTTRRAGSTKGTNATDEPSGDEAPPATDDADDPTPSADPDPTAPIDTDGDGVPDSEDCDPTSAALAGTRLLEDDLATEKGFFAAADGFTQASWTYEGAAYRQTRVADAADTAVFVKVPSVGDVLVEVRSASTEVSGAITPRLRQMFVLVGVTVSGGQLSAIGCGVEVVQGEATEQKTSVVRLAGAPGAVTTTPLQRVTRAALQVNEEFSIKARLAQGTLTCDVTNGGATTTASASGLGNAKGAVGFFTRQTKALFKQARICQLK